MKKELSTQVMLIGGGPAGLSLARLLAHSGIEFVCVDRKKNVDEFTTHCGYSFIKPSDYNLSEKIYLQRWDGAHIHLPHRSVKATVPKRLKQVAGYVDRAVLYTELYEQSRNHGTFLWGEEALTSKEKSDGSISSVETNHYNVSADIFVDCSGLRGFLTKKYLGNSSSDYAQGIEYVYRRSNTENNWVEMYLGGESGGGYGWIAPIGEYINIGIGKFKETITEGSLSKYFDEFSAREHPNKPYVKEIRKKYAGILPTQLLNSFHYKNTLHLGDCAGQVNPVVGEGLRWILYFSELALPVIKESLTKGKHSELEGFTLEWNKKYRTMYQLGKFVRNRARKANYNTSRWRENTSARILENASDETLLAFFRGEITPEVLLKLFGSGLFGRKKR